MTKFRNDIFPLLVVGGVVLRSKWWALAHRLTTLQSFGFGLQTGGTLGERHQTPPKPLSQACQNNPVWLKECLSGLREQDKVCCSIASSPLKAISQLVSLCLRFPDSLWRGVKTQLWKLQVCFMETEKKRRQGCCGRKEKETRRLASAVHQSTAAVYVELSEPGSCLLHTHWDCLHGVGVCVSASVCVLWVFLAEAKWNRSSQWDWQTSGSFSEKHMAPSVLQFGRG